MKIAVVGVGGTGTFAAQMLTNTPHYLLLIDGDVVEEGNLNRQNLFTKKHVYKPKAWTAGKLLNNKKITTVNTHLTTENSSKLLKNVDFVLDCTDNWLARMTINQYCLAHSKRWVYCGAIGSEVMVSTISRQPCFGCFAEERPVESCGQAHTTAQATSLAAAVAVQELLDLMNGRQMLEGKLFYADTKTNVMTIKPLKPKKDCSYCIKHEKLDKKFSTLCGGKDFIFYNKPIKQKESVKKIKHGKATLLSFKDGRVLVKNARYEKAVEANEWLQRKLSE